MKHSYYMFVAIVFAVMMSCKGNNHSAINTEDIPTNYLNIEQVVNSADFLPAPPDTTSAQWKYDVERYLLLKLLRDSLRGKQAVDDAYLHGDSLGIAFSQSFGIDISREKTPAIYRLITHMREDAGTLSTKLAKEKRFRRRPFVVFNEHTPLIWQEKNLINNGSYPSGHAAIGYAVALVLSEINPARCNEIMKRGYEIGESRVILGFHFDSDVRAGRLCGSMIIPILHNNPEFLKDLDAAKKEFNSIK